MLRVGTWRESSLVWTILIRLNGGNSSLTTCRQSSNVSFPFVVEFMVTDTNINIIIIIIIKAFTYLSLVRPLLEYAAAAWDPYRTRDINTLEMVQRRAARFAKHDYRHTTSVTKLLGKLDWPVLSEMLTLLELITYTGIIVHKNTLHEMTQEKEKCMNDSGLISAASLTED